MSDAPTSSNPKDSKPDKKAPKPDKQAPKDEAGESKPAPPVADKVAPPTRSYPEPRQPEGPAGKTYFWGTGRRKRAVARVRVRPGDGAIKINKRDLHEFFHIPKDRQAVLKALEVTGTRKKVDVFVNVHGGGTTGQAGAILLGIARALKLCNPDYEPLLRSQKLLHRDPRKVERKKYGQRGARRRFQFSKR